MKVEDMTNVVGETTGHKKRLGSTASQKLYHKNDNESDESSTNVDAQQEQSQVFFIPIPF